MCVDVCNHASSTFDFVNKTWCWFLFLPVMIHHPNVSMLLPSGLRKLLCYIEVGDIIAHPSFLYTPPSQFFYVCKLVSISYLLLLQINRLSWSCQYITEQWGVVVNHQENTMMLLCIPATISGLYADYSLAAMPTSPGVTFYIRSKGVNIS